MCIHYMYCVHSSIMRCLYTYFIRILVVYCWYYFRPTNVLSPAEWFLARFVVFALKTVAYWNQQMVTIRFLLI